MRLWLAGVICILCIACIAWCFATWQAPGRMIFLPAGDVGMGFRSYAGWLAWVEFAPWQRNPDHIQFEVPWIAVILVEILMIVRPFRVK